MANEIIKSLSISLSPKSTNAGFLHKGQTVNFINILSDNTAAAEKPTKVAYGFDGIDRKIALLNYETTYNKQDGSIDYYIGEGFAPAAAGMDMDVYKREVSVVDGEFKPLTPLKKVLGTSSATEFSDYNIENNRMYQYVFYPIEKGKTSSQVIPAITVPQTPGDQNLKTNWPAWSITELHPDSSDSKKFYASKDDVWLFNYNVETGDQSQNLSRTEYQTLGEYPRYAQGALNYIKGQVTCLLGSEVIPAFELIDGDDTAGGYVERRLFSDSYSSNKKVDMLKAWRKVVYSSNPKLLKDRKGQSFIVTLTDASNKPQDNVKYQPDTISFSWTQIGTTDDVTITTQI